MIAKGNHPELSYRGGQEPIIHLEASLLETINWAQSNKKRWAFTKSNAGSSYFEDYAQIDDLKQINWSIINATDWDHFREQKQAEFLIENRFPWSLVTRIGVISASIQERVSTIINSGAYQPETIICRSWYY